MSSAPNYQLLMSLSAKKYQNMTVVLGNTWIISPNNKLTNNPVKIKSILKLAAKVWQS